MADQAPRTVGTATGVASGLVEAPDGVQWGLTQTKTTATQTLHGTYAACKAGLIGAGAMYTPGAVVTGEGEFAGMRCDDGKLKKRKGDRGELTWTFSMDVVVADPPETPEESVPVYEVDFARIERPIETHPRYVLGEDLEGNAVSGFDAMTDLYFAIVREYFSAADARRREICDFDTQTGLLFPTTAYGEATAARDLISKKLKGVESYVVFMPVIRETTEISGVPTAEGAGVIEAPPEAAGAPGGYTYLSTAARRTNDGPGGAWRRIREWTGAYDWDSDLYPTATPTP